MRRWSAVAKLLILGGVALAIASCGATESHQPKPSEAPEAEPIQNSGSLLSGEFVLDAVEDVYRSNDQSQQTVFSFDDSGNFRRQNKSRVEEGAYLISTRGALVIYIEKVNGEQLAAARSERYEMLAQRDDTLTLQSGPSRKIILRRRL